jgi:hypothetical protein
MLSTTWLLTVVTFHGTLSATNAAVDPGANVLGGNALGGAAYAAALDEDVSESGYIWFHFSL